MFKKIIITMIIFIVSFESLGVQTHAATATVTLPTFNVMMNGRGIDNEYRKYPFIVYKGITYFPMTYHDSRFLGLETIWNYDIGLEISKTGSDGSYGYKQPELLNYKNAKKISATIASFSIKVNGKIIDNTKEKYPLLVFREITYFPMTWRFGVDEFGWEYNFNLESGLAINTLSSSADIHVITWPILNTKTFPYGDSVIHVQTQYGKYMPQPGNLYVSFDGNEWKTIGDENYLYGYCGYSDERGESLGSDDYKDFIDGWIYISAINRNEGGVSTIYKINAQTGETLKVE